VTDELPWVFILIWGIAAVAIGSLFAFRPEGVADAYIAQMARTAASDRLRRRLAPRRLIVIFYRIGGAAFMLLGVLIPALLFTGVIAPGR
jgi:hypothetical protein